MVQRPEKLARRPWKDKRMREKQYKKNRSKTDDTKGTISIQKFDSDLNGLGGDTTEGDSRRGGNKTYP